MNKTRYEYTAEDVAAGYVYRGGRLYLTSDRGRGKKGARAGRLNPRNGYRYVSIKGRDQLEHRVIFLLHHGYLPDYVDHINGDKADNRIENLRATTNGQNLRRAAEARPVQNASGHLGVYINMSGNYYGQVTMRGQRRSTRAYEDPEKAARARALLLERMKREVGE